MKGKRKKGKFHRVWKGRDLLLWRLFFRRRNLIFDLVFLFFVLFVFLVFFGIVETLKARRLLNFSTIFIPRGYESTMREMREVRERLV